MEAEEILQLLGRYGLYQFLVFFLISFVTMRGVWHLFGPIFLGADPGHHCRVPVNSTVNESIPYEEKDGEFSLAQCEMYILNGSNPTGRSNLTQLCQDGWLYGESYESTVLTEWDFVCDRAYLSDLGTSIFMAGMIVGSLCISPLSDKFGRKPVLLGALWLQGIIGIATAFVDDYIVFMVMRFFIGALNQTIGLVAYVMVPEAFPASSRTMPYIALFLFWSGGIMSLALLGYLIRNWRYLEIAISAPNFLTILYFWMLPESIPWLMAKRKYSEAEAVIRKAAKLNHVTLPDEVWNLSTAQTSNGLLPVNSKNGHMHEGPEDVDVSNGNQNNLVSEVGSLNDMKISNFKNGSQDLTSTGCDTEGDVSNGVQHCTVTDGTKSEKSGTSRSGFKSINTLSSTVADNDTKSISLTGYHKHSDQFSNKNMDYKMFQDKPRSYNIIDLFRTPKIRIYSLITFYLWLVNSLSYFGIGFSVPQLHGDTFLNLFISGLVEIPAYLICMATVECLGRRRPLSAFMLVCGVASIIAIFIPTTSDSGTDLTPLKTTMAMISKFGITGAYVTVYLFCLEIYPTVVRNLGVGIAAAFETVGGVAAPFIASSAKTIPKLPLTVFGVLTVVGGLLCLILPETHRKRLPETIEEVEGWNKESGKLQQGR